MLKATKVERAGNLCLVFAFFHLLILTCSCSSDETTPYSTYAQELVTLHTSASCVADRATTDGGTRLTFSTPLATRWAQTPDSLYRALLAFADDDATAGRYWERTTAAVTPLRADEVLVLTPRSTEEAKEWSGNRDAMSVDALWFAKDGRYINMQISVKSGTTDSGTEKHTIGIVADTVVTAATGLRHYHYRLCHSQNNIPAFYTVTAYLSVPTDSFAAGDTVSIAVPADNGTQERYCRVKP